MKRLKRCLTNNPWCRKLATYMLVVVLGIALFVPTWLLIPYLNYNHECFLRPFCSSISTPWGAFTSLFVFDGGGNLILFIFLFVVVLIPETLFMPVQSMERYIKFIALAAFPLAVLANGIEIVIWVATNHLSPAFGESTLVYVFWGLLFGLSAAFLIKPGLGSIRKRDWYSGLNLFLNLLFFFVFSIFAILYTASFLSYSPQTDYLDHILSFSIGTLTMLGFLIGPLILKMAHRQLYFKGRKTRKRASA